MSRVGWLQGSTFVNHYLKPILTEKKNTKPPASTTTELKTINEPQASESDDTTFQKANALPPKSIKSVIPKPVPQKPPPIILKLPKLSKFKPSKRCSVNSKGTPNKRMSKNKKGKKRKKKISSDS